MNNKYFTTLTVNGESYLAAKLSIEQIEKLIELANHTMYELIKEMETEES